MQTAIAIKNFFKSEQGKYFLVALVSSLFIALLNSRLFLVLLLVWACVGGYIVGSWLLKDDICLASFISGNRDPSKARTADEFSLVKLHCPVCGKDHCKRHRPELNIVAFQPWTGLKIPSKVDNALEQFLNKIIDKFIYSWYRSLSKDEALVNEMRLHFRFIASVLLRRIQKVDLSSFVSTVVTRSYLRHLHYYLEVKRKGKRGSSIDEAMLDAYGASMHYALQTRRSELNYLRHIAEKLFPHVLPLQSLHCRSFCVLLREITACAVLQPAMDVFANPNFINQIASLILEYSPSSPLSDPSPPVSILSHFAHITSTNNSCLQLNLQAILGSQELLFQFMQFLKSEASVNVLQFYLTVDELNSRILVPELSPRQLEIIHQDLCVLYQMYCEPSAIDHIQLDDDVIDQLKQICSGPPEGVLQLQKSTPLFRAHDHVYRLLETTFLHLFHQSDAYYRMMCGDQFSEERQGNNKSKKVSDSTSLSRISSKLKGVFKNTAIDGKLPDELDIGQECEPLNQLHEEIIPTSSSPGKGERQLRNLSSWRVSIPGVVEKPDSDNPRKSCNVFLVEVCRLDVSEEDFDIPTWTAERHYNEFYVLEQKLKEFHGEIDDCHLPPKKAFSNRSKRETLLAVKSIFEEYLQRLLTKPFLQSSELLHSFLNSTEHFTTEIKFGKFVKSGAMKLVKEKGQHLDPFLQTMVSSIENPKSKRYVHQKDGDIVSLTYKLSHSIYGDNAANEFTNFVPEIIFDENIREKSSIQFFPLKDLWDAGIFLAHKIFRAPDWAISSLMAIGILFRHTYDDYMKKYLAERLQVSFHEDKLVRLIKILDDTLFSDNKKTKTENQKKQLRQKALSDLRVFIPKLVEHVIGEERLNDGAELLIDSLQHPLANKQLSYILLDELITELFPELLQTEAPHVTIDDLLK